MSDFHEYLHTALLVANVWHTKRQEQWKANQPKRDIRGCSIGQTIVTTIWGFYSMGEMNITVGNSCQTVVLSRGMYAFVVVVFQ